MGSIVDAVFGGSAKDASRAQTDATRQAMREYKQGVAEAKREIAPRFEEATERRLERTQQAMDVLGMGFAPSLDAMSQGNLGAQQLLAGSMPQMQNAILGGSVDYSFMQPQGINFNAGDFLSGIPQVFNPPAAEQPAQQVPPQPNVPSNPMFDPFNMGDPRNTYTNQFGQVPFQIGDPSTPANNFGNPFTGAGGMGAFSNTNGVAGLGGGRGVPGFHNFEKLR